MLRRTCRLCWERVREVVRFPDLPLVDAYSRGVNTQPLYPCALMQCESCGHIQLSEVIAPELLFQSDYLFRTADYPWLVEHYREYAAAVYEEFSPVSVLEIGSNDGTLLKMFEERGCDVLGYDPSGVPAAARTVRKFFGADTAPLAFADLIVANHVFAHNDDLRSIVFGVRAALLPRGVFIFETNAGIDLLQKHLFDIVYHEHMDYHTVSALVPFFKSCGLQLFRIQHNDSKGGTLRGFVCHADARPEEPSVKAAVLSEQLVASMNPWESFAARLSERRTAVHKAIGREKAIGYGAAAGGIATMYHLGLEHKISWLVDDSPRRHGMRSPHANLEVLPPSTLHQFCENGRETKPKVVILSWRYAREIRERHPTTDFIVP